MALQKQLIPISLAGGVDTKTDEKQVQAGKLLGLENGIYSETGKIKKRPGYAAVGLIDGKAVASFRDQLLVSGAGTMNSRSETGAGAFNRIATFQPTTVTREAIARNGSELTQADSAIFDDGTYQFEVFAWYDGADVRYSVRDTATGAAVVSNALVCATASKPRVVAHGDYVLIFFVNGTTDYLQHRAISKATPGAIASAVNVGYMAAMQKVYDVAVIGARCYVHGGLLDVGPSYWQVAYLDSALTLTGKTTGVFQDPVCCSVCEGIGAGTVLLAAADASDVKFMVRSQSLSVVVKAITGVETIANVTSITGISDGSASTLFYTITATSPNKYVKKGALDGTYTPTATVLMRSVGLASRAFLEPNTLIPYVVVSHDSANLQTTYFVVSGSGNVVAKANPTVAGGVPSHHVLPAVNAVDATNGVFRFAGLQKTDLAYKTGEITVGVGTYGSYTVPGGVKTYTLTGVDAITVSFSEAVPYSRAEIGNALHLGCGVVWMYDGANLVEQGFNVFPEGVTLTASVPAANAFSFAVCYEWTDNNGQVHRSAPSVPQTYYNAGAYPGGGVTVTIPTLRITSKTGVKLVVYRTIANGTVYYRCPTTGDNNPAADTVAVVTSTSDADLQKCPQLYTTGNVVENTAPPPLSSLIVHRNRLWGIDTTNPLVLRYSKQIVPGQPVEFSDWLFMNIDSDGGPVTAIASMDDKLIVFKENKLFVVTGAGPSDSGANNDFSDAIPIVSDVGCTVPRTAVVTPSGLMFQSARGIYLLDRSLSLSFIGADAEDYGATVSAILMPSVHQVRFVLSDGTGMAVYDYLAGKWSKFSIGTEDATIWNGVYTTIYDSTVRQESGFADSAAPYSMTLTTSWIQPAGIQGFARAYRLLIVGSYKSKHHLSVTIRYDFSSTNVQSVSIPVASEPYQFTIPLTRQKFEAIQFEIKDLYEAEDEVGESFDISALTLECGIKHGPFRLPATRIAAQ